MTKFNYPNLQSDPSDAPQSLGEELVRARHQKRMNEIQSKIIEDGGSNLFENACELMREQARYYNELALVREEIQLDRRSL